jgi:hypothetical protein
MSTGGSNFASPPEFEDGDFVVTFDGNRYISPAIPIEITQCHSSGIGTDGKVIGVAPPPGTDHRLGLDHRGGKR